jgi:ribosome-interacting GTPase 1
LPRLVLNRSVYHIYVRPGEEGSMAVNQSPMYMKAEERYRSASTPEDKLEALEEMFRLVPKHKSSEKLQAQIKQKLKAAREEVQQGHHRAASGHRDVFVVPKQGAGQVVLLGAANVGKSSIVGALTDAKVEIAEFPFSTHAAVPGMALHEDVPIQLVDMPPIVEGHAQPGMAGAFRSADIVMLVVDLSAIDLLDQYEQPLALLAERGLRPVSQSTLEFDEDETAAIPKRTLVVANKCDLPGAVDNFEGLKDLCGGGLLMLPVSAKTGQGLPEMMATMFELLNVVRIYAKKPGKPVDRESPFILTRGATVHDMAYLIHRELAEKLKTARVWGAGVHAGQQVHHTHVLADKDVVELHF